MNQCEELKKCRPEGNSLESNAPLPLESVFEHKDRNRLDKSESNPKVKATMAPGPSGGEEKQQAVSRDAGEVLHS